VGLAGAHAELLIHCFVQGAYRFDKAGSSVEGMDMTVKDDYLA
jgi:hypothetical protein